VSEIVLLAPKDPTAEFKNQLNVVVTGVKDDAIGAHTLMREILKELNRGRNEVVVSAMQKANSGVKSDAEPEISVVEPAAEAWNLKTLLTAKATL
jgi:hypothetical protein